MVDQTLQQSGSSKSEPEALKSVRDQAVAAGQNATLADVLERGRQRAGSTPTVSIRIDPEDLQRARSLAAQKGLRYQTYLKMLLHEALDREARRAG